MTKTTAFSLLCVVGSLWSQQAATPVPPRPPTLPFSAAELNAIPLVPPRTGASVTKTLLINRTLRIAKGHPMYKVPKGNPYTIPAK